MKKSLFYRIYLSVVAAFLALLAGGLVFLYRWAGEYEKTRPDVVMREFCDKYLSEGDMEGLAGECPLDISPYETGERLEAAGRAAAEKKLEFTGVPGEEAGEKAFVVTADGEAMFRVRLRQAKKSRLGLRPYRAAGAGFQGKYSNTVTVVAPPGAAVTVNGIALDAAASSPEELPDCLKAAPGAAPPVRYTLDRMLDSSPEVAADGHDIINEGGVYKVCEKNAPAALKEFAVAAAHAYAAYMEDDIPFADAARYLDPGSKFYKELRGSETRWVWDHDGYSFDGDRCGEVLSYGGGYYRCRVSFTQVLRLGSRTHEENFDKYVYIKTGGGMLALDMVNPGGGE